MVLWARGRAAEWFDPGPESCRRGWRSGQPPGVSCVGELHARLLSLKVLGAGQVHLHLGTRRPAQLVQSPRVGGEVPTLSTRAVTLAWPVAAVFGGRLAIRIRAAQMSRGNAPPCFPVCPLCPVCRRRPLVAQDWCWCRCRCTCMCVCVCMCVCMFFSGGGGDGRCRAERRATWSSTRQ